MGVNGAACAVVVFTYANVQWANRAADVGGGTIFALETVHAVGCEAQVTRSNRAIRECTVHPAATFEGVSELVGAMVGADGQIVFLEDVRDFGIKIVR